MSSAAGSSRTCACPASEANSAAIASSASRNSVVSLLVRICAAQRADACAGEIGLEGPGAATVLAGLNAPVPVADYAHGPWGAGTVANASLRSEEQHRNKKRKT